MANWCATSTAEITMPTGYLEIGIAAGDRHFIEQIAGKSHIRIHSDVEIHSDHHEEVASKLLLSVED